jgi:MerR family redox-sensitive transcriptional activator SoxR
MQSELAIGEVARQAGVPASTLRYWERAGVLEAPSRVGGKRRYDQSMLRQISLIVLAKRVGLTLAETRTLIGGFSRATPPPDIWRQLATRKLPEIEQTLTEANAMKQILERGLRCDCLRLEDCLRGLEQEREALP